jgi:hypothetical protein
MRMLTEATTNARPPPRPSCARLVDEVLNRGDLAVIDEFSTPTMAGAARTWRGHPPTRRRFERIDEVYFFRLAEGRIDRARAWGLEDTLARNEQLGLAPAATAAYRAGRAGEQRRGRGRIGSLGPTPAWR